MAALRLVVTLAVLALASAAAAAAQQPAAEVCPALPAASGFTWDYRPGPDFDVCYAQPVDGGKRLFGIYLGLHPSFEPRADKQRAAGVVAGQPVTWYAADKDSAGYAEAIETVLTLPATADGYQPVAHVWVYTSTP